MPTGTGSGMDQCSRDVRVVELLVGAVADRDDDVVRLQHVLDRCRHGLLEVQAVAAADGDRPRMDPACGVGAGRYRGDGADRCPAGGGKLGTGRVAGADEDDPRRRATAALLPDRSGRRPGEWIVQSELKVAAPPVALGADPADHPGLLQDPEMVRHQVRGQTELGAQLTRRGIAGDQAVDNSEPQRFAQGGEQGDPAILRTIQVLNSRYCLLNFYCLKYG